MSRPVLTTPEADADLADAFDWYEAQRTGLGPEFLAEVAATLSALEVFPEAHEAIRGATRRAVIHRFPFGVLYILDPEAITVTGVLHVRRDPRVWASRIGFPP